MLIIRRLTPGDDLRALVPFSRAFFEEYAAWHPLFALGTLRDEDITAFFAATVSVDDKATFLATDGDVIVGYLAAAVRAQAPFYAVTRLGAISGLMVRADRRRQGIATRLMAAARAWFAGLGVAHLTLSTSAANAPALAFYQSQGLAPHQIVLLGEAS